jgi:exo-beta-1,3-glucanase (GH17 family)
MKSLVILLVDHGDTTDPLVKLIDDVRYRVEEYDFRVDVTPGDEFRVEVGGDDVSLEAAG